MRKVLLESPYAGDVEANVAYARAQKEGRLIEYRELGGAWREE